MFAYFFFFFYKHGVLDTHQHSHFCCAQFEFGLGLSEKVCVLFFFFFHRIQVSPFLSPLKRQTAPYQSGVYAFALVKTNVTWPTCEPWTVSCVKGSPSLICTSATFLTDTSFGDNSCSNRSLKANFKCGTVTLIRFMF